MSTNIKVNPHKNGGSVKDANHENEIMSPIPHAMSPQDGDVFIQNMMGEVNKLPDGPLKTALVDTLNAHKGKGWTKEEHEAFENEFKGAQAVAKIQGDSDALVEQMKGHI